MQLYRNEDSWVYMVLYDGGGVELQGLTPANVVLQIVKAETFEFISLTPTVDNFKEVGKGVYAVLLTAADLDTLGELVLVVSGATLEQKTLIYQVAMRPILPQPMPSTCIVYGSIKDLTGLVAGSIQEVRAQIKVLPTIMGSSYISTAPIVVFTDMDGVFKIQLVRGAMVMIDIPSVGYRRQIEVPDLDTADLASIV